ncbi:MAG: hypothetical protein QOF76_240 [Solirubrobacteraceae bacterium]|jgi:hypothetical protein|nr:hypothetical protein [Solirubrobacteraceae bacterium]
MPIFECRSIAIAADPAAVHAYVADARNLPTWAPAFATSVEPDGDRWAITQGDRTFGIVVRASVEHGTVDLLDPTDLTRGAFSRVLPSSAGSEYQFCLFFPDDTDAAAVTSQMTEVERELERVRAACER